MKVVSTFHPPSSVTGSVRCHLTSDGNLDHLVVVKTNRVDVYSAQPDGLRHECGTEIWGRISTVRAVPTNNEKENLVLLTDHPEPRLIFLEFTPREPSLKNVKTIDLYERTARPSEFLHTVLVHPSGDLAIVSCYTGKLRVVQLTNGKPGHDFDVILPELNLLSIAFLPTPVDDVYLLGILHLNYNQEILLLARDLRLSEFELSPEPSLLLPPTTLSPSAYSLTETAPSLIPVPSVPSTDPLVDDYSGGVLVVGGRKIQLYELSSKEWREKYRGKRRRLSDKKKKNSDHDSQARAKEKEQGRVEKKRKAKASIQWPWDEITAWTFANDEETRYFLGDAYGRLALLSVDALHTHGLILIPLGEISPPTTLAYITSQILYVGSHLGDSQLVKVHLSAMDAHDEPTLPIPSNIQTIPQSSVIKGKGKAEDDITEPTGGIVATKGKFLEVVDMFKNIAPILDAVLADTDGSGQPQIVTASGGKNTGSLRVVRNGADFHEEAVIEGLGSYTKLWPIRPHFQATNDTHILATDGQDTLLFRLDGPTAISHVEPSAAGFVTSAPTLAASNVARRVEKEGRSLYEDSPFIVQVTPKRIVLVEYDATLDTHNIVSQWSPKDQGAGWVGRDIVAASLNPSQFALGLTGGRLAVLRLDISGKFSLFNHKDLGEEISVLTCNPMDPLKPFSIFVAVGFWKSKRVELLYIVSTNTPLAPSCPSVTVPSLPRSLLFHNFGQGRSPGQPDHMPHLLIGLADGTLVSYAIASNKTLEDRRVFSLGSMPVSMACHEVGGRQTVFASGSRAAILYLGKGTLAHSPVLLKNVAASSQLNAAHWPSCLILATTTGLVVGRVEDVDKMHIRTVPLGLDNPRRIFHDPTLRAFGVACVRNEPGRVGELEVPQNVFQLMDDTTFDVLGKYTADVYEDITAIHAFSVQFRNETTTYYCVGTVLHQPDEVEPTEGRLHILALQDAGPEPLRGGRYLNKITTTNVSGCVYALTYAEGLLVAAINTSVMLFKLESGASYALKKVSDWNHSYLVTSLVARGSRLFVGDAISSISVLDLVGEGSDASLKTVARDYGPLWPVSIESWDQNSLIGANSDYNLFTFTVQPSGQRIVLDRDGYYHLDDLVNKFLPGSMHTSDAARDIDVAAKMLFFTSSGRIGVVMDMGKELSLHMTALERNMAKSEHDVTGSGHSKWRAPVSARGKTDADGSAFGFLDGDFVEKFLDYPQTKAEGVMKGTSQPERLAQSYKDIRHVLEALQALH
ncbi:hypothetical protein BV25DRAFT_1857049 [Artomyces pyxidatus]|uniref:Uncharacterized protein n=1 Tax=Artomyces pyxidatus TaxID=48021 RepID=A0ACB8SZQ3_9AGAM|nr:hypothetical protein BV25DRAFT_1857049 [Artomyces pyxidatus]